VRAPIPAWRPRVILTVTTALLVISSALVLAQQIWVGGGGWGRRGYPPQWANEEDFDGSFRFCRAAYDSHWREGGGSGWDTDYPGADINFSVRFAELTRVYVRFEENRQPRHIVVSLTDPLLFRCPMLFMSDTGTMALSSDEVEALRAYFDKGGMLWVDDFWGTSAWTSWAEEIGRVLPPAEFPVFDIPPTHPVMRTLYQVEAVPQVPNIGFWRRSGGDTSERGWDSAEVHFRGIQDSSGRLMVVMTHNTDIADSWEREGENADFFDLFSPKGYAVGVNLFLYGLAH
jgi:hypothetical protein